MPVLDNTRHERFAQEIAKGVASREAYINAGYEGKNTAAVDASASRLLSDARIAARVDELLHKGANKAALSVQRLLEKLDEAFDLAKEIQQPATMVSAAMAQAKISGQIIDRKEIGSPGDFDGMSTEDVRGFIRERIAALGIGMPAARASRGSGAPRGKPH